MTDTTVAYHRDGYAAARPAINVKAHNAGLDYWPEGLDDQDGTSPFGEAVEAAYQGVVETFWEEAADKARELGLGEIEQEGRSGGWLVFTQYDPYIDPDDEDPASPERLAEVGRSRWLAAYRQMVEWCDAYIAAAPASVRRLAREYAIEMVEHNAVSVRSLLAFRAAASLVRP